MNHIDNGRTFVAVTVGTVALLLLIGNVAKNAEHAPIYSPCEYEDSVSCVWDAETMGNGQGQSFVSDKDGNITYIGSAEARSLLEAH